MRLLYSSLTELLLHRFEEDPHKPLFVWHDESIATNEVVTLVTCTAQLLRDDLGVIPRSRVAVLSFNRPETLLLLFAAAHIRCTLVLINARYSPTEVASVLADAAPAVLFYEAATEDLARTAVMHSLPSIMLHSLEELFPEGRRFPKPEDAATELASSPTDSASPLLMLYTSGTTGTLKGVPLTQQNLLANISQVGSTVPPPAGTEALVVTPFFHAAILPAALVPLAYGLTLVIRNRFNPQDTVELLAGRPISWTVMVPTMMQACLDQLGDTELPATTHPRYIYYGASPAPRALIQETMQKFRAQLIQSYGLTEATQAVTVLTPDDHRRGLTTMPDLLRSAGRPIPATELAIWDPSGSPLPPGQVGEIVVRGPQVMLGYWNRPDETRKVLVGDWLRTGDVGYLDEQGYLYVTDRIKDIVISGGENVFSTRVEDVIRLHPAVREVAVIGLPHPVWGETVHAIIALREGSAPSTELASEIVDHCRRFLGGFEIPRSIEFLPELPRSATGKILKRLLRERPVDSLVFALDLRNPTPSSSKHTSEVTNGSRSVSRR